jgi:hypothetical protein
MFKLTEQITRELPFGATRKAFNAAVESAPAEDASSEIVEKWVRERIWRLFLALTNDGFVLLAQVLPKEEDVSLTRMASSFGSQISESHTDLLRERTDAAYRGVLWAATMLGVDAISTGDFFEDSAEHLERLREELKLHAAVARNNVLAALAWLETRLVSEMAAVEELGPPADTTFTAKQVLQMFRETLIQCGLAGGGVRSAGRTQVQSQLKPSLARAYESYQWTCSNYPDCIPDDGSRRRYSRAMYDKAMEESGFYDGKKKPSFESWKSYVQKAERAIEGPKNTPRAGQHGGSIIRSDQI